MVHRLARIVLHAVAASVVPCVTMVVLLFFPLALQAQRSPRKVCSADAFVQAGKMRFVLHGQRLLRMQRCAECDDSVVVFSNGNPLRTRKDGDFLYIFTDSMEIRYLMGSAPDFSEPSDSLLRVSFPLGNRRVTWYPGKHDALNLRGALSSLQGLSGDDLSDSLPLGVLSRAGWSFVDNSSDGRTDYFLLAYGHDYKSALADWHALTGKPSCIPPRWALGYWLRQDSLHHTDEAHRTLFSTLKEHGIQASVILTDSIWYLCGKDSLCPLPPSSLDSLSCLSFSGDTWTRWSTLAWLVYYNAISAGSGLCHAVHNIGGRLQLESDDAELQLRWMQAAAFMPVFYADITPQPDVERRPWMLGHRQQFLHAVALRHSLLPYLEQAWRQVAERGVNVCRPLYYEWPERNEAYTCRDEFMCGDTLLVAPILHPSGTDGRTERSVWLPPGLWWDVCRQCRRRGPLLFSDSYTLDEVPYFKREE